MPIDLNLRAERRAFAQMSRYYADQLQLQQQEADRLNKALKKDVEQFRQANQVGPCGWT